MHNGCELDREDHEPWLLIKKKDGYARADKAFDVFKPCRTACFHAKHCRVTRWLDPTSKLKKASACQVALKALVSARLLDGAVQAELPASLVL